MSQYTIELLYEPIYFIIIIIGINLIFKTYNKPLITQAIIYSVIGVLMTVSFLLIKMNKSNLEKEKVHYSKISQILTGIIILSVAMFLYYFIY